MDIRVMLADDQPMMRKAMRDVLLKEAEVASVALAVDGAMAIELSRQDSFDVAVLDIAMTGTNGIAALTGFSMSCPLSLWSCSARRLMHLPSENA